MSKRQSSSEVVAAKDDAIQQAVPTFWRPVLTAVVRAFVQGDYQLKAGVPGVEAISTETATHICDSIHSYGATLTDLPDESWDSSVCMWYGTHWDALVDLWTEEEGRSDLVLSVRVTESGDGLSFKVHMVYVP